MILLLDDLEKVGFESYLVQEKQYFFCIKTSYQRQIYASQGYIEPLPLPCIKIAAKNVNIHCFFCDEDV